MVLCWKNLGWDCVRVPSPGRPVAPVFKILLCPVIFVAAYHSLGPADAYRVAMYIFGAYNFRVAVAMSTNFPAFSTRVAFIHQTLERSCAVHAGSTHILN